MFSIFCQVLNFLLLKNNGLNMCLFFGQITESALKQGKIRHTDKLSADLSTGLVDGIMLAYMGQRLQRLSENHTV